MNEETCMQAFKDLGVKPENIQGLLIGAISKDDTGYDYAVIAGENISIDQSFSVVSSLLGGILLQAAETNEEICISTIEKFYDCLEFGVLLALKQLAANEDDEDKTKLKMLTDAYRVWIRAHYRLGDDDGEEEQDSSEG